MVSYLVMKNNLTRILRRKSTYLLVLLIPLLLMFCGSLSVSLGEKHIRVGVVGNQSFLEKMQTSLGNDGGINVAMANSNSIHTDLIMRKYQYVISDDTQDPETNKILEEIKQTVLENTSSGMNEFSNISKMLSMLLTVYMTIATIYAMKYLQDKKDGVIERFFLSGSSKKNYATGYVMSNIIIIGVQLLIIFPLWMVFDKKFTLPLQSLLPLYIFIIIISSIYGIIITLISSSELMAGVLGSSVAVILSILGGTFVSLENMPDFLQKISVISPIRWLMQMI